VRVVDRALQSVWHEEFQEGLREPGYCRIAVFGVGGAGSNTVNRLVEMGIQGAECIAINTDMQHLNVVHASNKVLIGEKTTRGLGSGGNPKIGRAAMEESIDKVESLLGNVDIAFVAAGMGGGTGTGAAPVIADMARRKGAIVIGVVTTPFRIEKGRGFYAAEGLAEMRKACDTVVIIDNNKLMESVPHLPLNEAFGIADSVLANMIKGIVETISAPSLINLDFADFKTIVRMGGVAVVGMGESDAPNRAEEAVQRALRSPLLNIDYAGATGALIHVSGDSEMTIEEANRVGEIVTGTMSDDALVIWGARINPELAGTLRVTLVITGVHSPQVLSGFEAAIPPIFNVEPNAEPEKPLKVDLNLYQLENFEL